MRSLLTPAGIDAATDEDIAVGRHSTAGTWLLVWRRYLLIVVFANLLWEVLHLPLYTIWYEATPAEVAFAVVHCTGGDVLIATFSLVIGLVLFGHRQWPDRGFYRVAVITVALGVLYTIFSEWLNIVVRKSWAYSDLMPVIPLVGTGISPIAQWLVIPLLGLWWARRTITPPHADNELE